MAIDDAEGGGFGTQMHQDASQHRVLVHIGKIPGVKGMAVIHRAGAIGADRLLAPDRSFRRNR
jgi:hypothetical protein